MARTYTTYETKARFSEILRQVRAGKVVRVSYRGEAVAEIRPLYEARDAAAVLKELEQEGVLAAPVAPAGKLEPVVKKRGALERFLETRE